MNLLNDEEYATKELKEVYNLLGEYTNLLRAMYASVIQGNWEEYRVNRDGKEIYHFFGNFIDFPVKVEGEEYIAHVWVFDRRMRDLMKLFGPSRCSWDWMSGYYKKLKNPPKNREGYVFIPGVY